MFKVKNRSNMEVVIHEVYEEGYSITVNGNGGKPLLWNPYRDYLMSAKKNTSSASCELIPTGISSLDKALGGGLKAGLYVVGANPGAGKTSLLLHILSNISQDGKPSLFFSLDMSDIQTTIRLMANASYKFSELDNLTINDLSDLKAILSDDELRNKVNKTGEFFNQQILPYVSVLSAHTDGVGKIDDTITYVESIEVALKNYKQYHNCNPVVVVDFLQLLQNKPVSSYRDEYDREIFLKSFDKRIEMDKIVEKLKKYSTTYNVPIIVITSTNRSSYSKLNEYNPDSEYDISFSKESGNIEYLADVLIRLTPGESTTNFGGPEQECVNLHIVKSRFGKAHLTIPLNFIPEYAFFSEVTND